jgi:fucose 4-O-acetylase-like acetyltransferase
MKSLVNKWWFPILSHLITFPLTVVGIPFLLHQIHFEHKLTFFSILLCAIISLTFLAKIHKVSYILPIVIIIFTGSLTFFNWPKEQLGNWGQQYGGHIIASVLIGYLLSIVSTLVYKKYSKRLSSKYCYLSS